MLVALFSLCIVSTVGRGVFLELDVGTIPAIPLSASKPVSLQDPIWENCTKSTDESRINSLVISPNPPVKGENISVTLNITFKEVVTSGKITLKVLIHKFPIFSHEFVLCDIASDAGDKCPIKQETRVLKLEEELPSIPPGTYTGTITAIDQEGKEILCFKFTLEIRADS